MRSDLNATLLMSRDFKVFKGAVLEISLMPSYLRRFPKNAWYWDDIQNTPLGYFAKNQIGLSSGLGFSYKDFSLGFSYGLEVVDSFVNIDDNSTTELNKWQTNYSYGIKAGYRYSDFNFGLKLGTAGRDREFGGYGDDYLYPGDPRYTRVSASIGYNYSF